MRVQRVLTSLIGMLMVSGTLTAYGFTDVKTTDWFYNDVKELEVKGVIHGYIDETFKPYNSITGEEALKLILEAAETDIIEVNNSTSWSDKYIKTAEKHSFITTSFEKSNSINREKVAEILVQALNLSNKTTTANNFTDTQNKSVDILFEEGLIKGVNNNDTLMYKPLDEISRAEISAIIKRVNDYKNQKDLEIVKVKGLEIYPILSEEEIKVVVNPITADDIENIFLYMAYNKLESFTVKYSSDLVDKVRSQEFIDLVEDGFYLAFSRYPEYVAYTNKVSLNRRTSQQGAEITFHLKNELYNTEQVNEMRDTAFELTEEKLVDLIVKGDISSNMTDTEKAKKLYEWIALNTKYDLKLGQESFIGYGQIVNGLAVCQGYTSTYNTMLRMLGIQAEGIAGKGNNTTHIWTKAVLEGQSVHIDTTYGDPTPDKAGYVNYDYFARDSAFISKNHTWNAAIFGE